MYAKDADATIQRVRTFHLNDEAETEIDQTDTVEGKFAPKVPIKMSVLLLVYVTFSWWL